MNERLAALTEAGTSVWLDQIRRGMIEEGELARMVAEDSLRGVTSNPAIFEKAILGSPDYDDDIEEAANEGLSAREVYRRLAVRDVQLAADVLRPVYDDSGGQDGYVSLEVAPRLAHDTEGTLEQARMYWGLVDRPNLMIKIPATDEGIPAIEEALYEGLNVNVTLLFAVSAYERVMEAFVRAMERRQAAGRPLDRHSVASFFVSRVDTEIDKRLEALGRSDLAGRAGLANARAAYRAFQRVFEGERFAALREAGSPVQRPLWASTGVKNPAYPETLYVDGLVGPETVNTMPLATLTAAGQHGEVTGATAAEDPAPDLEALAAAGIDLDDVTAKLLRDGIDAFVVPMNKLLDGIEAKREAIVTGRPAAIDADLPAALEAAISGRIRRALDEDVARRIWERDGTLWAPEGTPEVTNRLGWLDVAEQMLEQVDDLEALAAEVRADGITDVVLLRHGRLEPRARGLPALVRRTDADAARARLDAPGPDPRRRATRSTSRRRCSSSPPSPAGRSRRCRSSSTSTRCSRDGAHYVAVTDPGSSLADARRRARLPARVRERPGHRRALLGAVVLRARARRRSSASTSRAVLEAAAGAAAELPARRRQPGPLARRRARRAGAARPRQADVRGRRAAASRSASGSSSSSRSRPASRAAASCRSPTSRSSTPTRTATTACSCTSHWAT